MRNAGNSSISCKIRRRIKLFTSYDIFWDVFSEIKDKGTVTCFDLGCGNGATLKSYGSDFLHNVIYLVDQHIPDVQAVRDQYKQSEVHVFEGDLFRFLDTISNESADIVVLQDVLEHLESEKAFLLLSQVYKKLCIGGSVIIRVPNGNSPFSLRNQNNDITHVTYWGSRTLESTMRDSGFETVRVQPVYEVLPGLIGFASSIFSRLVTQKILSFLLSPYVGWSGEFFWTSNVSGVGTRLKDG